MKQQNPTAIVHVEEDLDPEVGSVLEFLARDMELHPEHVSSLSESLMVRIRELVGHVKVDLDTPIDADPPSPDETHEDRLLQKANEADVNPGKALFNLSREQLIGELCE